MLGSYTPVGNAALPPRLRLLPVVAAGATESPSDSSSYESLPPPCESESELNPSDEEEGEADVRRDGAAPALEGEETVYWEREEEAERERRCGRAVEVEATGSAMVEEVGVGCRDV